MLRLCPRPYCWAFRRGFGLSTTWRFLAARSQKLPKPASRPMESCVAGFELKEEDGPPVDLRYGEVQFLGFRIRIQEDHFELQLGQSSWDKLIRGLMEVHRDENPQATADAVIRGWIDSLGPIQSADVEKTLIQPALAEAAKLGFRELSSRKTLMSIWKKSNQRWQSIRKRARFVGQASGFNHSLAVRL